MRSSLCSSLCGHWAPLRLDLIEGILQHNLKPGSWLTGSPDLGSPKTILKLKQPTEVEEP